ncbi:ATP-binding protein [Methylobacterium aquaticum]|uniref:ATP-binding protein n=1 Tax=Methylobacterium aquaticum TaxID=270351 RepID=UPI0012E18E55|nr:ATP-binding protein [Methylobacterium aquaticum]
MAANQSAGRDATIVVNIGVEQRESEKRGVDKPPEYSADALEAASADLFMWPRDIEGHFIERPELALIENYLKTPTEPATLSRTVLLFGEPGSGKSALLATLGERLTDMGAIVLGIKADMLPPNVSNLSHIGRELGLGNDLAQELRSQSSVAPLYVLIDQLDAVAALIDGSGGRLRALSQLVRQLRLAPGIRIVASARPFEFNADGAFRTAFPSSGVDIVELALPSLRAVYDIMQRVGVDPGEIPDNLREIVRIPQALRDIVSARRAGFAWSAMTSWRYAQTARFDRLVEQNPQLNLERVTEHLIQAQRQTGALWTAQASLPFGTRRAVERLRAEGIIRQREDTGLVGFSHQTWAESLDARLALAQGDLAERIKAAGHNLLARPQALAMLRYIRDAAQEEYDAAIGRLWVDGTLKRHLRHLILDLAAGYEAPTQEERRLVMRVVAGVDAPLAERALRLSAGKPQWFPLLRGAISDRMASTDDERAWSVLHWLSAAVSFAGPEVLTLLRRHWLDSSDRLRFTPFVLERLEHWDEQAFRMFDAAVTQAASVAFSHVAVVRRHAEDSRHDVAAHLLGILWDRLVIQARAAADEATRNQERRSESGQTDLIGRILIYRQNQQRSFASHFARYVREISGLHDFCKFAKKNPKAYANVLVPKLASLADVFGADSQLRKSTAFDYWELQSLGRNQDTSQAHFDVPLIEAIRTALEELARSNPLGFISIVESNEGSILLLDRLFALALSSNMPTLANTGFRFIEKYSDRLVLGDRHGDDQADTLQLITALSPCLSVDENDKLVGIINKLNDCVIDADDDVHQRRRIRRENRRMRARLLAKIDRTKLPSAARRFIGEEMRAVPDAHRAPKRGISAGYVRSPMATDAMERASDQNILKLFSEITDNTDWKNQNNKISLIGGSREASAAFAELAKKQPDRVLNLIDKFSPDTHQRPVGDALRTLVDVEGIDPARILVVLQTALDRGFGNGEFLRDATFVLDSAALRLSGLNDYWVRLLFTWIQPPKNSPKKANNEQFTAENNEKQPLPTSVLFGQGSMRFIAGGNNYMVMRAVTHALICRNDPAYLEWIDFLEWRVEQREDAAVWKDMCRELVYLRNVEPGRVANLIAKIFSQWPEVRDSDEGAVLIAHLLQVLPKETIDAVLAGWRGSEWPLASVAIGEILALRAACLGTIFSIGEYLQSSSELQFNLDIITGIANVAVEFWNNDDPKLRHWARENLALLAARTEARVAQVCASFFQKIAPLPNEDDTRHLLRIVSSNLSLLKQISDTAIDDRLGEVVDDDSFHDVILDMIDGLIQANKKDLNDIRTSGPLLAQGLLPIVITIHRDRIYRERALNLFEDILDINQTSAEEFLLKTKIDTH